MFLWIDDVGFKAPWYVNILSYKSKFNSSLVFFFFPSDLFFSFDKEIEKFLKFFASFFVLIFSKFFF